MLLWQKTFKLLLGLTKKLKDFCQICKNCPILIWLHKKIIKWRLRHIQIQVLWSNLIETSRFSNVRKSFKVFNHPYPRFESFLSEKQVAPSCTSLTSQELVTLVDVKWLHLSKLKHVFKPLSTNITFFWVMS